LRIPFDVGFVYHPKASDEDNAMVLRIFLEALVACDIIFLRMADRHRVKIPDLYHAGVVYDRTKVWDSIPDLYRRKHGDCKSLTAARIAELRHSGHPALPVFRFAPNPITGGRDFHILVQRGKGFEDPSKLLGMEAYHHSKGLQMLFPD
jgi:hypothetical protein